jgi:predicted 2-oxoglutarate/Fe(II)-dependent dioxygenase YbiX|tara:strand:- start:336 stop:908 length:573 start_codon:yes stop_codon:yes gene_type:complete
MNLSIPPILGGEHGVIHAGKLSSKDCSKLIALHKTSPHDKGKIQILESEDKKVVSIRQVDVWRVHENQRWVDELLVSTIRKVNEDLFEYNLSGLIERPQLLRYNAGSVGYDWHVDIGQGDTSNRKLSMSIILNDSYKGGELQFFSNGISTIPTVKGDMLAFSSFIPHKVTNVTSGQRWAIVAWFSGPQFR